MKKLLTMMIIMLSINTINEQKYQTVYAQNPA